MTTAAVILAAGSGSRFHGDGHKLLSDFRGRPLASWALWHAIGAGLDETLVVTGAVDLSAVLDRWRDLVRVVDNTRWAEGQATSLQVAVDAALAANPDVIDKVRSGKVQAAGAIVGAVMKATKGQADAKRVRELVLTRCAGSE